MLLVGHAWANYVAKRNYAGAKLAEGRFQTNSIINSAVHDVYMLFIYVNLFVVTRFYMEIRSYCFSVVIFRCAECRGVVGPELLVVRQLSEESEDSNSRGVRGMASDGWGSGLCF